MSPYRAIVAVGMADKGGAPVLPAYKKYREENRRADELELNILRRVPNHPDSKYIKLYNLLLKDKLLYADCFGEVS